MIHRHFTPIAILMAVSIFCTGYAAWSLPGTLEAKLSADNALSSFNVETQTVTLTLGDYGIEMTTAIGNTQAKRFEYMQSTAGTTVTRDFLCTTLSILFKIDDAKLMSCTKRDYRRESLLITCKAEESGSAIPFEDHEGKPVKFLSRWLTLNKTATLSVIGYPSAKLTATVSVNSDHNLELAIPLEAIHNLVAPCANGKITENGKTYYPLELSVEFEPTGVGMSGPAFPLSSPCNFTYTFGATLTAKQ